MFQVQKLQSKELWKWKSFGGWISDISVNSYREFAGIGQGGVIQGYDKSAKRWKTYPGNKKGGLAIAILANGELFVCFKSIIERFIPSKSDRFKGKWVKIPGCCRDIGSDGFGSVIVIGCDKHHYGYGIWRNLGGNYHRWVRILGQAVVIDVGSRGHIVVANNKKNIFYKENYKTAWVMTAGLALDVCISVGGRMVVIGTDQHVYYSKTSGSRPSWVKESGMGKRIACFQWRNPMVVGMDNHAYKASK